MNAHPINLVHFYSWQNHEMVTPCGATGERSLSTSWDVVDCPDCLRTHPVPIVKAYCRPESHQTEPVYECGVCGEFHTQAAWAAFLANYDGAPSETDTMGTASNDRAALRDAGRRHTL